MRNNTINIIYNTPRKISSRKELKVRNLAIPPFTYFLAMRQRNHLN